MSHPILWGGSSYFMTDVYSSIHLQFTLIQKMLRSYIIIFISTFALLLSAQKPTALEAEGNRYLEKGMLLEAAERFEKAGRIKNSDPDLMLKAGETYYQLRDYRNAANCLQIAKRDDVRLPLAALRYGRALKQCGLYSESIQVLQNFAQNYKGDNRASVFDVVQLEIEGSQKYLQLSENTLWDASLINIKPLSKSINSPLNEFSPWLFNHKTLYFSQFTSNGKSQLMRTTFIDSIWQDAELAKGLPEKVQEYFGTGTFSKDGKRFYYAKCKNITSFDEFSRGYPTDCGLYMIERKPNGDWSVPEKLPEYINMQGTSIIHPFVTASDTEEILFFSSNRAGGLGGFDIYTCRRPLSSDILDFSFPQNPGANINSAGDDISPAYDPLTQNLWFSSNGKMSFGGLDIFYSHLLKSEWEKAINAGIPYNSPADDLCFFPRPGTNTGFLISNRLWKTEKTTTIDQDIFEIHE
jgi:tetratricopeptide (TPR) repeat protein